jgi:peptidyl-Lys metalloendopeptidase
MSSEGLSISLEFDKRQYKAKDPQNLLFVLKNTSKESKHVLKWHTPLEGFNSNMFRVDTEGTRARYLGRLIKRGVPKPEDYIVLKPGESVSANVDIAEAYDIVKAGDYRVAYKARLLDVKGERPAKMAAGEFLFTRKEMVSPVATFRLVEERKTRLAKGIALDWRPVAAKKGAMGISFRNCTPEQEKEIAEAHTEAVRLAKEARSILTRTKVKERPGADRFETWFGTYDKKRYATISSHFLKIRDALSKKNVVFNSDCDPRYRDAYAYVSPSNPYEIYLCNAFWKAPVLGTDCRAGVMIHEISHFYVVAETDDHVYGQNESQDLAKTDPDNAIDNADSHEYFAENDPQVPMT